MAQKSPLEHQILWRIAGQKQFAGDDNIGIGMGRATSAQQIGIGGHGPDGRVQLRHHNFQGFCTICHTRYVAREGLANKHYPCIQR